MADIIIDSEFNSLIAPLAHDEYRLLEQSIIDEGCRDALVVWGNILVDGHHRHKICTEHGIPYRTEEIKLEDRHAAINWMIANQLGRRNLSGMQQKLLWAKRYKMEVKEPHRPPKDLKFSGLNEGNTAERLGNEYGVSDDTILNAVKLDAALGVLADMSNLEVVKDIVSKQGLRLKDDRKMTECDVLSIAKIRETEPEIAQTVLDELLAGNAKTVRQGAAFARRADRTHEAQSLPDTVFNVIYADPPWEYDNVSPPIGSVIEAAVQEHSSKPDDAYDIIERLYPGCSYVELFARGEREGWDVYGNELN